MSYVILYIIHNLFYLTLEKISLTTIHNTHSINLWNNNTWYNVTTPESPATKPTCDVG